MAILEIIEYPDPRLKEECKLVTEVTDEIRAILSDMAETMYAAPGVGLAGPQVGAMLQIAVVDVGEYDEETETKERRLYKLVNPKIVSKSGSISWEEGCLSIPEVREKVTRSAQVTVEALDEFGNNIEIEAEGLLAVCLQHEIDHLHGTLFIDRLSPLKKQLIKSKLKLLVEQFNNK